MTIDRARKTYDPARNWRAVLAQQGRVTLEADVNEQTDIAAETLRGETLDIVGPVGTPDGGYVLTTNGADVTVSGGTIYVGGIRFTLEQAVATAKQPGWLDMPAWPAPAGNNLIALLAIEQTVIAVEDNALQEVALGGPDSAGRRVFLQHFLRIPSTATVCAKAEAELTRALESSGLAYDAADCEVLAKARLKISVIEAGSKAGPCDPPVTGGYLGADNQMIHVAVTDYDAVSKTGHFVWGFNNASFLYRATAGAGNSVILLSDPLDPDHTPQPNQAVEILATTVDLGDGVTPHTAAGGNFIAAGAGTVMVLGVNPYAPATRTLSLPASPGAAHGKLPFFVRLWQSRIKFTAGVAEPIDDIGLAITITDPAVPQIGGQPFWQFAVRPATPQSVYPQRYLDAPQPPEGPREFLAVLGIAGWANGAFTIAADCSVPFLPLTKLHDCDCCSLTLDPAGAWRSRLNAGLNAPGLKTLNLCFQAGEFSLDQSVQFRGLNIVMSGAGGGTLVRCRAQEVAFLFTDCPSVTISDITIMAGTARFSPSQQFEGLNGAVTMFGCMAVDLQRVRIGCASDDLRAASCITVKNPEPPFPGRRAITCVSGTVFSHRVIIRWVYWSCMATACRSRGMWC